MTYFQKRFTSSLNIRLRAVSRMLAAAVFACGALESRAELGLAREAYGVWDRTGFSTVAQYPFTRGQAYSETWFEVNNARNSFQWEALDAQLAFAEDQNQQFNIQISTVGGAPGASVPSWMLDVNGGDVPSLTDGTYTYGYYLNDRFKLYYEEMVRSLANHVRNEVPAGQRTRIGFVRVDTGATGDEEPYENANLIPPESAQYLIDSTQWLAHRLWAFEVYRKAFQEGPGPVIPLLFGSVEAPARQIEWDWVTSHVKGGYGVKYGGTIRGHHLTDAREISDEYKQSAVDPATGVKLFSRNEMDGTWQKQFFQLNIRMNMYWTAVEQLHPGMSVWDVTGACLNNTYIDDFAFAFEFFNKWSAELIPATAGGGFCILHEGLDSSDTDKFPENSPFGGTANQRNGTRYTRICESKSAQGALMGQEEAATWGAVKQKDEQVAFNDAGWKIVPGNYDRFITQINPDLTSKGLWRINGPLTTTSHPYDRFARRSDNESGQNTMFFDIHDDLLPSIGQPVQITVTYLDRGSGQFKLVYDALSEVAKVPLVAGTALEDIVTKGDTNTWKTKTWKITDWQFGNRGTNGSDLQLVNVAMDSANPDTIFHGIEMIKLAEITVGTVGMGTVTGRNNAVAFTTLPSSVMEGQRLELKATPAPGWRFTGWSGALTSTDPNPFLFPTKDTRLTATFAYGSGGSSDNFNSGTWTDGIGWSDTWISGTNTSGTVSLLSVPASMAQLNGGSGIAKITRTLDTPLANATLSFDWDLDRIGGSDFATAEVYNGSSWVQVWSQNTATADLANTPNLVTSGNLSLVGTISQVRFILNANQTGDTFFIDNVSLTGTPVIPPGIIPLFNSDPISQPTASDAVAYSGTLSGSASDPNSSPLTFSMLPGGPAWLSIAPNGALSGTPTPTDAGLNRWTVQINSAGGSDMATLLIDITAPGPNPPSSPTYSSPPVYTNGTAITNLSPASSGGSVLRYVVTPAMPNGLRLNSTTGIISGTPTAVSNTTTYTITASNTDGSTTGAVSITVIDIPPSALTYLTNPAIYRTGGAITANTPSNSGGTVVSYSISPPLPAGLALSTTTGAITGTPTLASQATLYTVTATNTGGSTSASVSIGIEDGCFNSTAITINDLNSALPYPSTIIVPSTAESITKVTATLYGFSHTQQNDVDILLVGPSGQTVVLMSDVGGNADAANADLTFDDSASDFLTTTAAPIPTGIYKPSNVGTTDVFSSPAPVAPYGSTLSNFNRTNPSGTWSLYVMDDRASNTGTFSGGWSLSLEISSPPVTPPSALSYSTSPATYITGTAITSNTPTSSGGAVVSYAVTPALPEGLALNTTTGVITGTPLAEKPSTTHTITATNTGGSTPASLNVTVVSPYTAWAGENNLVQGPDGDDDGDGNTNYFEFVAGLVPTDVGSVFKTTVSSVPGELHQIKIVISPIIGGRTYAVKSSESLSLSPANWIPLSNPAVSDDANERTVVDTAATEDRKFYVIEVRIP